jgi:hypothetical protein
MFKRRKKQKTKFPQLLENLIITKYFKVLNNNIAPKIKYKKTVIIFLVILIK